MDERNRQEGGVSDALQRRHADLLVHGGTAMTPNGAERIDIACVDGRVVALGALHGTWSADVLLDAGGLHVLPGVVDSQVHFREPGLTHKETLEAGTRGAVLGGVTTIFEMPNTHPLTLTAHDRMHGPACDRAPVIGCPAAHAGDPFVPDGATRTQVDDAEISVVARRNAPFPRDAEDARRPGAGLT